MKIFLDLDGILSDFVSSALETHNREYPWFSSDSVGCYDMVQLLGISPKDFWKPFDHDFWASLAPLKEGFELLRILEKGHDVYLATAPALSPSCSSGKHAWVRNHLPEYWAKTFICQAKHVFAAIPDSVLIDDADHNVDAFKAAGGKAIIYPQPWNSAHIYTEDRLAYIARSLYGDRVY